MKIKGHSVEYRVYAEDPSRNFLPSIGHLTKYKEPTAHENIRIDTGVREGSEISMYYDPMISKLITWGKDRKEAMDLIDNAFDEYVVQGVAHNIGFGKSIVANESFAAGDYTTAFIPDFYPEGFRGDSLKPEQKKTIALAAHNLKNIALSNNFGGEGSVEESVVYVTVVGMKEGEKDQDWKVEKFEDGHYQVTDLESGKAEDITLSSFEHEHNSLIKMDGSDGQKTLQILSNKNDLNFDFYYGGGKVETIVYDEAQFKYKHHMAAPVKIDSAKMIQSPMPGAVVSVNVAAGDTVVDGQELCILEAMKMQNVIKAEKNGVIKSVKVKAGDSVTVDELLIEFE